MKRNDFLRTFLKNLQKLKMNTPGVTGWLLRKDNWQIVIMRFDRDFASEKSHVNKYSQWGVVLEGNGTLYTSHRQELEKGDSFFIPEMVPHRVEIRAGYKDITIFNGPRY